MWGPIAQSESLSTEKSTTWLRIVESLIVVSSERHHTHRWVTRIFGPMLSCLYRSVFVFLYTCRYMIYFHIGSLLANQLYLWSCRLIVAWPIVIVLYKILLTKILRGHPLRIPPRNPEASPHFLIFNKTLLISSLVLWLHFSLLGGLGVIFP